MNKQELEKHAQKQYVSEEENERKQNYVDPNLVRVGSLIFDRRDLKVYERKLEKLKFGKPEEKEASYFPDKTIPKDFFNYTIEDVFG